ncbi:hypothetical protein MKX50_17980 [Paenibacillus sp. FSL W8-0186]|uniref:Bacteriocin n=1 Tax=Paenibacillus woosongensis TaxID=307580 RepID=A0ABQ4MP87_9BACL|nr:hypothetical protein [Paenibacillus woosongensis]GIP57522.1 hypothetical protein J15TS10_13360 [Paenibacillus woosongensis]
MKIVKIKDKEINLNVRGQGCDNDCAITVWKGKTSSSEKGCWSADGYNAQTTSWW